MRLHVSVHGLHFAVPCGEGAQSVKWLGLAVAQRYALAAPRGRCRTREDAHIKPGFYLPASITKSTGGQVLPPTQKIADVCKDNDHITVLLQQEVPVNEIGAPQLSAWAVAAFSAQPKNAGGSDALLLTPASAAGAKAGTSLASDAKSTGASAVSSAARADGTKDTARSDAKTQEDEMKAYARSELLQQVKSGQFQSEMEFEAAFLYDWSRLRVDELEKDTKEREAVQELLLAHFAAVNAAYMHYAVSSGEAGYGMNGHELAHFLHECGLYHFQQDAALLEKLFAQCTRHDAFLSLCDRATLARVGFFHALLRAMLSSPREASGGSTKETLEKKLKERVLPTVARLTSGPFRDHTHHDKIVALFQEAKPKLLKLYAKYAQEHGGKASSRDEAPTPGWPQLLTATALKTMLYDCGVFCVGDTRAHDDIFNQAMEQCFAGMRGMRAFDDQEVVFAEFVEVLTRVGMTVLEENALPPKDATKITLDALRSLPVKSLRK